MSPDWWLGLCILGLWWWFWNWLWGVVLRRRKQRKEWLEQQAQRHRAAVAVVTGQSKITDRWGTDSRLTLEDWNKMTQGETGRWPSYLDTLHTHALQRYIEEGEQAYRERWGHDPPGEPTWPDSELYPEEGDGIPGGDTAQPGERNR